MSAILEFIGLSPAGANGIPAVGGAKEEAAYEAGKLVMQLVRDWVTPSQIVTRDALENAAASVVATGGSTNGLLHLLAIAREFGLPFTIDDFDRIAAKTPVLADMKPWGRYHAVDLQAAGGFALIGRELERRPGSQQRRDRRGEDARRCRIGGDRAKGSGRRSPARPTDKGERFAPDPARQSRTGGMHRQADFGPQRPSRSGVRLRRRTGGDRLGHVRSACSRRRRCHPI
jgi:hypothetical protein